MRNISVKDCRGLVQLLEGPEMYNQRDGRVTKESTGNVRGNGRIASASHSVLYIHTRAGREPAQWRCLLPSVHESSHEIAKTPMTGRVSGFDDGEPLEKQCE